MSYSIKQKMFNPEPYSDYHVASNHLYTNQCQNPLNYIKNNPHKRKTSQVSTLSFKSKNRNVSSTEKKIQSVQKHNVLSFSVTENKRHKTPKTCNKQATPIKKQFSLQRIQKTQKIQNPSSGTKNHLLKQKKLKLKLNTQRKLIHKNTQSLTSRFINSQIPQLNNKKNKISSQEYIHSSFVQKNHIFNHKINQIKTMASSKKKHQQSDKKKTSRLKISGHNLQDMATRCSKVMTEYYQKITQLKNINQYLNYQNQQLKTQNQQLRRNRNNVGILQYQTQ